MHVVTNRSRGAFTLIEILVVLAIIGVLAALLVPAVQMARESSRRASCVNNLHQIGLACQQFENQYGKFPPSQFGLMLLPYLGFQSVYDQYRANQYNIAVTRFQMPVYMCPSARVRRKYPLDYRISSGIIVQQELIDQGVVKPRDFAGVGPSARKIDVEDGLSNTIHIVEYAGKPDRWREGKLISLSKSTVYWIGEEVKLHFDCPPSKAINCDNHRSGIYAFHPGGANTLFVDGSVHFLVATMDADSLVSYVTADGGDVPAVSVGTGL